MSLNKESNVMNTLCDFFSLTIDFFYTTIVFEPNTSLIERASIGVIPQVTLEKYYKRKINALKLANPPLLVDGVDPPVLAELQACKLSTFVTSYIFGVTSLNLLIIRKSRPIVLSWMAATLFGILAYDFQRICYNCVPHVYFFQAKQSITNQIAPILRGLVNFIPTDLIWPPSHAGVDDLVVYKTILIKPLLVRIRKNWYS